jgi:transaldolase/glucose-6-phosphate isomerase
MALGAPGERNLRAPPLFYGAPIGYPNGSQQQKEVVMNPLKALNRHGQSVWLDFMRRTLIGKELARLLDEDGVVGITSNPAIFEKAIGQSADYDPQFSQLMEKGDRTPWAIYEELAIRDIQLAADQLRPIYDATRRRDGYVSLEVSPYLANDTEGTIAEARRLWAWADRANLMVKVPGTKAGVGAIETLIADGININVTLLFGLDAYLAVAEAFIRGLERYGANHDDLGQVASVASFFISRIDSAVDARLDALIKADPSRTDALKALQGKVAIANAVVTYQRYKEIFSSDRWSALAERGAQTQRLLWASTGTKNPAYPDTLYVDRLIGPHTVNTMPPATMDAFRDHGTARTTLEDDLDGAARTLAALPKFGIKLDEITDQLVVDGVQIFADAADKLLEAVEKKRVKMLGDRHATAAARLPAALTTAVEAELEAWRRDGRIRKLWARDATLWSGTDEAQWLGWLDTVEHQRRILPSLELFAIETARRKHVVLLGMGGSSLGPAVIGQIFGVAAGHPVLHVLDSTDPTQIRAVEAAIDLAQTQFIVSSKSGGTFETAILKQYFFDRVRTVLGDTEAPKRFSAVTDPGSTLQQSAESEGFGHVFLGEPGIGGRYSVLSIFGLVPAAAMGVDIARLLDATEIMIRSCGPDVPPTVNPGIALGVVLGVAWRQGRDKVTIVAGPGLEDFGIWAEQLLAESTGKHGKALIPVAAEPLGSPDAYGTDRIFVHVAFADRPDPQAEALLRLEQAGHPVVRLTVASPYQLGQEFFRWEMATAVAGAVLGINPFDQPDVEASKIATRKLIDTFESKGGLPDEIPIFAEDGISLYADARNAGELGSSAASSLDSHLAAHLGRLKAGDYAAFLAYLPQNATTITALQTIRRAVRDRYGVATCVGFGPRFLHSTGQAYKGGPNTGLFVQITCEDANDLAVPGHLYSFGTAKSAEARGDFAVLAERGRRALHVHLGPDLAAGLERLLAALRRTTG